MGADLEWYCGTCGAHWTGGEHTADCEECGGGAMSRPCSLCGGRCGAVLQRAPLDSRDYRVAHWVGSCKLDPAEQMELMRALADKIRGGTRGGP